MTEKSFVSYDGKKVGYREWRPENVKALFQISHGMAESTARYDAFAEYLKERGFLVFGDDHRGHGLTDGRTGYSDGEMFEDTLKDMATLTKMYKEEFKGLPLVFFGHSYGSFLTQAYIERYPENADRVILCGSAYLHNLSSLAGKVVATVNCFFGKGKKAANFIANSSFGVYNKRCKEGTFVSSVPEECDKYDNFPDCNFVLSNAFYSSFFRNLPKNYKKNYYKKVRTDVPMLIISGRDDPVGGYGKLVEKLYDFYKHKVGVEKVDKVLYDGVRHEVLNDTSRDDANRRIGEFADGALTGGAAANKRGESLGE